MRIPWRAAILAWAPTASAAPLGHQGNATAASIPNTVLFEDLLSAVHVMQNSYFKHSIGTWPSGNDWTRAVMGTHIAGALRVISKDYEKVSPCSFKVASYGPVENLVGRYFGELISYYFGEDAFAIRNQAYDDILWVVLGWLETIQFIDERIKMQVSKFLGDRSRIPDFFYGHRWMPSFAHRARVFWELAEKGWGTELCGGGMTWNPRLEPYKNAITNELWIAASIGMYLHFPGDKNTSPWGGGAIDFDPPPPSQHVLARKEWLPHDPLFSHAAELGFHWLQSSGMMNQQGLYADGFHISGYNNGGNNTKCDVRDEMVYTYNQGVILSGHLGLFSTTGNEAYLHVGHELIQSVIKATGWDLEKRAPVDDLSRLNPNHLPRWRGLGRGGVLEEACDLYGSCSQDGQTFKGIWMHHFATFCSSTSLDNIESRINLAMKPFEVARIRAKHFHECKKYIPWLAHNTAAAIGTRNEQGKYGMWWTPGLLRVGKVSVTNIYVPPEAQPPDYGEDDYRNRGVPENNPLWKGVSEGEEQKASGRTELRSLKRDAHSSKAGFYIDTDPNLRGRGRTVETQGGALALLRAYWIVSKHEWQ